MDPNLSSVFLLLASAITYIVFVLISVPRCVLCKITNNIHGPMLHGNLLDTSNRVLVYLLAIFSRLQPNMLLHTKCIFPTIPHCTLNYFESISASGIMILNMATMHAFLFIKFLTGLQTSNIFPMFTICKNHLYLNLVNHERLLGSVITQNCLPCNK